LLHDNAASGRLAWYKVMKYSICCIKDSPTGIENESNNNYGYELHQNYPNPFNPSTKISWQSPVGSWQTIKVYDVLGNEVITLVDEYKEAGIYEVEFDGSELTSGIYFYKFQAGLFVETKKMAFLN
jgi:hypothetical protein